MNEKTKEDHLFTIIVTLFLLFLMFYDGTHSVPLPSEDELPQSLSFQQSILVVTSILFLTLITFLLGKKLSDFQSNSWAKGFLSSTFLFVFPLFIILRTSVLIQTSRFQDLAKVIKVLDLFMLIVLLVSSFVLSAYLIQYIDFHGRKSNAFLSLKNIEVKLAVFGFQIIIGATYVLFYWILALMNELYGVADRIISEALTWWFRVLWLMLTLVLVIQLLKDVTPIDEDDLSKPIFASFTLKSTIKAGLRQAVVLVIFLNVFSSYPGNLNSISELIKEVMWGVYSLRLQLIFFVVKFLVWLNLFIDWKELFFTHQWAAPVITYMFVLLVFLIFRKEDLI